LLIIYEAAAGVSTGDDAVGGGMDIASKSKKSGFLKILSHRLTRYSFDIITYY
jgi:hypothetical protein